jgi:hypothetical protein
MDNIGLYIAFVQQPHNSLEQMDPIQTMYSGCKDAAATRKALKGLIVRWNGWYHAYVQFISDR